MNTVIANKQRSEISHLEYAFISRQECGNRTHTLKQDTLKHRPSSLASENICVDRIAIVRLVNE